MPLEVRTTDEQTLFAETAARFINDTCPLPRVRELAETEAGFDHDWWRRAAELGWTSMLGPEHLGGGGLSGNSLQDLALVSYERGRLVSPGPFVSVNAALSAIAAGPDRGPHDDLVAAAMAGQAVITIAIDEPGGAYGPESITAVAGSGAAHTVSGAKEPVEAAIGAAAFVVAAQLDGEPSLFLVEADAPGVSIDPREAPDLVQRYGAVAFDEAPATLLDRGTDAVQRVVDIATALQLAETVGALDRTLEITVEWGFDRHSFGRPLVSYQELKHRYADMRMWLEACTATTAAAVAALGTGSADASMLVSVAKAYVGRHATEIVQDCVQIHGGIGVTWEHDMHLYLRRVTLHSALFGSSRDHHIRLGAAMLDTATSTDTAQEVGA